jgi:uncharacterized protein (UPF0147 family)
MTKTNATDSDVESAFASWSDSVDRSLAAANELNEALESVLRERTKSLKLQVSRAVSVLQAVATDDNFHMLDDKSKAHVKDALSTISLKVGG